MKLATGAVGVISVASNIIPAEVQSLVQNFLKGDLAKAQEIHARYYPLFRDLFIEPNPAPIKVALAEKGLCAHDVRLPLCEMDQSTKETLLKTLKSTGVL